MAIVSVRDVEEYLNREFSVGQVTAASPIIDATVGEVEDFLGRPIEVTALDETYDLPPRWGGRVIVRSTPVVSVESVHLDGTLLVAQDDYAVASWGLRNVIGGLTTSVTAEWPQLEIAYHGGLDGPNMPGLRGRVLAIAARRCQLFAVDRWNATTSVSVEGESLNFTVASVSGQDWLAEFTDADRRALTRHRRHRTGRLRRSA